ASSAAAGAGRVRELALADLDVDARRFEPQDFGSDNRSDCALPGAEVLRGAFGAHGAAAADSDLALVRAGGIAAPGMQRHADAAFQNTLVRPFARRGPFLLPAGQLHRNVDLVRVDLGSQPVPRNLGFGRL